MLCLRKFLLITLFCYIQQVVLSLNINTTTNSNNNNKITKIASNPPDNVAAVSIANKNKPAIPKWKKQACALAHRNRYTRYKCDEKGDLRCLPGWQGDLCDVPLCRRSCDPQQGYCQRPGECRCKIGFSGVNCDKCITLPGCQYGNCTGRQPFECNCIEGWRGIFCQEPICKKGCHPTHGYCDSPSECQCRIGWTGETCSDCQVMPGCFRGTCNQPLECRCLPGFTGFLCDKAICSENCHKQNGYCRTPGTCRCKVGWMGDDCSQCHKYPGCKNGSCKRPWDCICEEGWGGFLCDEKLDYCDVHPNTCENGGRCRSLSKEDGNFSCECMSGYRGERCERSNSTMPMTSISWNENVVITPFTNKSGEKPLLSERNATTISTSTISTSPSPTIEDVVDDEKTTTNDIAQTLSLLQQEHSTAKLTQNSNVNDNS